MASGCGKRSGRRGMKESKRGLGLSQPGNYSIRVAGHLDRKRIYWFSDFCIANDCDEDGSPITVLKGHVQDQAMLHGLLAKIRDLGLPLLSVDRIPNP
jgi:hypothetical protein